MQFVGSRKCTAVLLLQGRVSLLLLFNPADIVTAVSRTHRQSVDEGLCLRRLGS